MEDFHVRTKAQDDWTIFEIVGDLDVYTAQRLSADISRAINAPHGAGIALDLSQVNFLDSTGLSVIVRSHKRAKALNRGFKLIKPKHQIRRILQVTDLISLLPIEEEIPENAHAQG